MNLTLETLLQLLWLACTVVVISTTEPYQIARKKFFSLIDFNKCKTNPVRTFLSKLTQCQLCLGFWSGSVYGIYTGHSIFETLLLASATGFLSEILRKLMWR